MAKQFVVADIHGGFKALLQCLERADVKPEDELIPLGDYMDGWPDVVKVIEFLMKRPNTICLKGNHEAWAREGLLGKLRLSEQRSWMSHGGEATVEAYSKVDDRTLLNHLSFIDKCLPYYVSKGNLFVHGGISLKHPIVETREDFFYWDRSLFHEAIALHKYNLANNLNVKIKPWYKRTSMLDGDIFIGHTTVDNAPEFFTPYEPIIAANVHLLDTAAAYKGKLTIMDVNTKEYWQSDPVHTLYPNHKGRN